MLKNLAKMPWPYFGGKAHAASAIWQALGDVRHYVEPLCGTCSVLVLRPHPANRPYYSETVNDAHGLLVNALRAIAFAPDATAEAASWYVCEADIMARQFAVLQWADVDRLRWLKADMDHFDPIIAGYWIHGMSCWIGGGYADGSGAWVVGADGRITQQARGPRGLGAGQRLPHIADNGRGVTHANTRAPGVANQLPHISDNGQGINRPGTRAPGVANQLPHISDDGKGVNRLGTREPGVATQEAMSDGAVDGGFVISDSLIFHDMTMPDVRRWFQFLSARFRHVRIVNGDWSRVCTDGALFTIDIRMGKGVCGMFFDPPYSRESRRDMGVYAEDDGEIAHAVRAWCTAHGDDKRLRIVLAGFDTEHQDLERHGWRVVEWYEDGFLRGGMGNLSERGHQQQRERLWVSPHCQASANDFGPLFAMGDTNQRMKDEG